jgi:hypothetical protein
LQLIDYGTSSAPIVRALPLREIIDFDSEGTDRTPVAQQRHA